MGAWLTAGIRLPLAAGAVALILYAGLVADPYDLHLLTVAGTYALMALGYEIIFGHAGALSLAQGTFFGLGAYVTGILGSQLGWPFPATFALSITAPVLLAALIAFPVLRLESHYFALATLGIGQVALLVAVNWESVTGGANGLPGVPPPAFAGLAVPRGGAMLVFVWVWVAIGLAVAAWYMRGLVGRAFAVMRDDPTAARAIGVNTEGLRFQALLLSAGFAGAGGALNVHAVGVISPESLGFPIMVAALTMTVVGGRLHPAGAVIGALLLIHIPEWARILDQWRLVIYGAAMLAMVVAAPEGLVGLLAAARVRFWPERAPGPLRPLRPQARARAPAAGRALLEVAGATRRFGGVVAVDAVGLDLRAGEILGIIGPNGSGKTTLANLITGVERPDAGVIRLAGADTRKRPAWDLARHGVARTFQAVRLPDALPAIEAVAVARAGASRLHGRRRHEQTLREAMAFLDEVAVADRAFDPCGSFPAGVRRRVEIARALALDPVLLVLDEPAAGLDRDERAMLTALLRNRAEAGLAVLVIEHRMDFLLPLAGRIACLDHGRLIAEGTPDSVRDDPAVAAAYLGRSGSGTS